MHGKRLLGTAVAAAVVLLVGWIDYVTGPEIGLSLLYLIPVAISGWFGGVASAVFVASAAGATWLAADLAWRTTDTATAISLWNAFTRLVIYNTEGVFLAFLRRDRDMLRRLARRESALARTDHATGLTNMRGFLELANAALQRARAAGEAIAIVYIDLDNFKTFNDRLGHAAGDDILDEVAQRLIAAGEDDTVTARLGGDEFALLLPGASLEEARAIADRVAERVRDLGSAYSDIGFGATVGVAYFRELPASADDLIREADDAMYEGKASGKGRVVVHQR